MLSDRSPVMGGLEAKLIEEGLPREPGYRQNDTGHEAPSSESRPPSTTRGISRPHASGRRV
ncbi:MAG: hypothetical protein LZF62_40019 [Nitrospira sp.]|nr:MAG: hypothetical protein LZF62_40019 [Nitrospira sp.]